MTSVTYDLAEDAVRMLSRKEVLNIDKVDYVDDWVEFSDDSVSVQAGITLGTWISLGEPEIITVTISATDSLADSA